MVASQHICTYENKEVVALRLMTDVMLEIIEYTCTFRALSCFSIILVDMQC